MSVSLLLLLFFFFFTKLCYFAGPRDAIDIFKDQWETTSRETGPNDLRRVVWAVGDFFFII